MEVNEHFERVFNDVRRLAEKNIPNCAGFSFGFKARGRRIASLLTAVQRTSWTIKTSKLVCSLIEIALGDWQKRIYQIAQDFRSDSRRAAGASFTM